MTLRWHLIISSGAEGQKAPDSSDAQIERETSDSETREAAVPFSFPLCSTSNMSQTRTYGLKYSSGRRRRDEEKRQREREGTD